MVVILNRTTVTSSAIGSWIFANNKKPRINSKKGYTRPYKGMRFARGSYIAKDKANPERSKNLKRLKTKKNKPIKSSIKSNLVNPLKFKALLISSKNPKIKNKGFSCSSFDP